MDCSSTEIDRKRLPAYERIIALLDNGSFIEIDELIKPRLAESISCGTEKKRDGVVAGYGKINGKTVFVFSQDFSFFGGSVGEMHAKKISSIIDLAIKTGSPIIGFYDSGGARIQEGIDALSGCGKIFRMNIAASGRIPQISAIMGPCAGSAAYSPALTDFIFMVKHSSHMFLTGPQVIKAYTGEDVDFEKLGGSDVHGSSSGIADFITNNENECIMRIRELINLIPSNCYEIKKGISSENANLVSRELDLDLMNKKIGYDMHQIIRFLVDDEYFFEIKSEFAKNILTGLSILGGSLIGIIANQPLFLAGSLDSGSAKKAAKFINFCSTFNIPILSLVDVPGFLGGTQQEHQGVIKDGARMIYAYSNSNVPKITVIIRKAYGGSFLAMGSKDLGADLVIALPSAEVAIMGVDGAMRIICKNENNDSIRKKTFEYQEKFGNPYFAASTGHIDKIIELKDVRQFLINAFEVLAPKSLDKNHLKLNCYPM